MMPAAATQPSIIDVARVDQAVDRLVAGDERAEQDDRDDRHAGEILDAAEPVGEAGARLAPREA